MSKTGLLNIESVHKTVVSACNIVKTTIFNRHHYINIEVLNVTQLSKEFKIKRSRIMAHTVLQV